MKLSSEQGSQPQKHLSTWAVSAADSYWVPCCEMQQWGCQKDGFEPVLAVQGPALLCNTDKPPCCWHAHCQAEGPSAEEGRAAEGTSRTQQALTAPPRSHLQSTKPLPLPDRRLYPGAGELLFLVWGRNATHPSGLRLVWGYAAKCNLHRLASAWTPVLDFLI